MSSDSESLICPITHEVFRDPVIAEDGRLYERAAIIRWIDAHGTSPFTRQVLNVNHLQPDDLIRRRAEQRRGILVSYTPRPNQARSPASQATRIIPFPNPVTNIEQRPPPINRHNRERTRRIRDKSTIFCHICAAICVMIILIVAVSVAFFQKDAELTYPTRNNITIAPNVCFPFNAKLRNNSCISSFTSVRTLTSGTCNSFTHRPVRYCFTASKSIISIIFAFQQTSGYWDLDNIELTSYDTSNIFRNGAFRSGSLFPHYSQCQSTGSIKSAKSSNERYFYSDGTRGRFGYLGQVVSIEITSQYCLSFNLENRNGSRGSFMILLGN